MRPVYIMLIIFGVVALSACGASGADTPTPESGDPTVTAPVISTDAYPAQPTPTPVPDNYPAPTTPEATAEPTAYPADKEVWIVRPLGQQCVDPSTYEYADLEAAVASLTEADVEVVASEEVTKPVCQACDCSTSEHFRVQIRAEDLALAQSMGWFQE